MMPESQIKQRLVELRAEHEKGEKALAELNTRRTELEQTLLRIAGAIQVLEELLQGDNGPSAETKTD